MRHRIDGWTWSCLVLAAVGATIAAVFLHSLLPAVVTTVFAGVMAVGEWQDRREERARVRYLTKVMRSSLAQKGEFDITKL
jgi:hypothetical protein